MCAAISPFLQNEMPATVPNGDFGENNVKKPLLLLLLLLLNTLEFFAVVFPFFLTHKNQLFQKPSLFPTLIRLFFPTGGRCSWRCFRGGRRKATEEEEEEELDGERRKCQPARKITTMTLEIFFCISIFLAFSNCFFVGKSSKNIFPSEHLYNYASNKFKEDRFFCLPRNEEKEKGEARAKHMSKPTYLPYSLCFPHARRQRKITKFFPQLPPAQFAISGPFATTTKVYARRRKFKIESKWDNFP